MFFIIWIRGDQLLFRGNHHLRRNLENVHNLNKLIYGCENVYGFLSVNILFHDTILEDAKGCQDIQCSWVAGIDSVEDETNDDLFPRWYISIPE